MTMAGGRTPNEEMTARWSLTLGNVALLSVKPAATRLGFTAQLVMHRTSARFGWGLSGFPHVGGDVMGWTPPAPAQLCNDVVVEQRHHALLRDNSGRSLVAVE